MGRRCVASWRRRRARPSPSRRSSCPTPAGRGGRRVKACGVCHTDLHYREGGINDDFPFLLGHEAAGVVEAVGPDVTDLAPGDFVVLELAGRVRGMPGLPARPALVLLRHPQRHAEDDAGRRHAALPRARHRRLRRARRSWPPGQCTKVNPAARPEAVGLLGCGVMAGHRRRHVHREVGPGDSVAVFGCGGVGCAAVAGSKLAGAAVIIGVDKDPRKLELGARSSAPRTRSTPAPTDPVEAIKALTGGNGADVCIEAVGNPAVMEQAFFARDLAGTLVQVGVPTPDMRIDLPMIEFFGRGGALKPSWYGDCLPRVTSRCWSTSTSRAASTSTASSARRSASTQVEDAFARMQRGEVLRSVVVLSSRMTLPLAPFGPRTGLRGMVAAADQLAAVGRPRHAGPRRFGRRRRRGHRRRPWRSWGPTCAGSAATCWPWWRPPGRRPRRCFPSAGPAPGPTPGRMRREGLTTMPLRGDIRSVQVPGAVDGWLALHERYGRLPLAEVLAPAIELAEEGFPASIMLALASHLVHAAPRRRRALPRRAARHRADGARCRASPARCAPSPARDATASTAASSAAACSSSGAGHFAPGRLQDQRGQWCTPLRPRRWGHELWTVPPPSQGYLTLAGAAVAEAAGLGTDPDDPQWAHLLVETWRAVGHDRPDVLFDGADGDALLDRGPPDAVAGPGSTQPGGAARRGGGTRHGRPEPAWPAWATATRPTSARMDADGLGVSLTQSNALDFGSHLVEPPTGVFLHNRGVGFSLAARPSGRGRARPAAPHTLSPMLVTKPATGLSRTSSAPWAATPSRRSSASSWPGCCRPARIRRPPSWRRG